MNKTTIYLPDDLRFGLKRMATVSRRSEADLIREAIREMVQSGSPPRPCGGLFDSGRGGLAEHDEEALQGFGADAC